MTQREYQSIQQARPDLSLPDWGKLSGLRIFYLTRSDWTAEELIASRAEYLLTKSPGDSDAWIWENIFSDGFEPFINANQ